MTAINFEDYGIYGLVIGASMVIILSYFFNVISRKTNIPSVILLIALGLFIKKALSYFGAGTLPYEAMVLEFLGTVGLIFIVLEAALDLEISRDKWPTIWKSLLVALLALLGSTWAISQVLYVIIIDDYYEALLYAVPLSIMSSAIIIPSVGGLVQDEKEFMVYESTFSDILGIMFFYFLLEHANTAEVSTVVGDVLWNIFLTLILSVVACYLLIFVLQRITAQAKLFLTISVLLLIYSLGKLNHLSPLILILMFGLMLNNGHVFWRGALNKIVNTDKLKIIRHDFHMLTLESAFVIRTFFFVIFGATIVISSIFDLEVVFVSMLVTVVLYIVRLLLLSIFKRQQIFPLLYIAPRGLITILLFFQIGSTYPEFTAEGFNQGIVLFVILLTSMVMTISLMQNGFKIKSVSRDMETGTLDFETQDTMAEETPENENQRAS